MKDIGQPPVIAIIGTRYSDFSIEEEILAPFKPEIRISDGATTEDFLKAAVGADVVLAGSGPRIDGSVLERLSCRAIIRYGIGTENIDLNAASKQGVWVVNVPDYAGEAVATHTVALILAASRELLRADALVKSGRWGFGPLRPLHLPHALIAGVVGLGTIGSKVAEFLALLGFTVLGHDPIVKKTADWVRMVSFNELLRAADVVTLHVPGRSDGKHLIGGSELKLMKHGSTLINTARGSLVDLSALLEGLSENRPARAALDVYPSEPPDLDTFAHVDQLILTPHMAWYTEESEHELRKKASFEALKVLSGEEPSSVVVRPEVGMT